MIIEDDPMVREINAKFLKKIDGFILYKSVSNLTDAKRFVLEKKPDLILLDVFLPKENGIDFLKWIRSEEIAVDVILITADKTIERVQEALRYGAEDYIIKPFDFERLEEALQQFKERHYVFKKNDVIEQEDLDKLISNTNTNISQDEDGYIKGLNKYTYNSVWGEVEKSDYKYFTAEEVAEKIGIARVTVRKYLDYMEKSGKIEMLIEYGKVGRPQHKYRKN
jgi:two-component system, CitB family, response regulator